ncbi:DELTA-sagatoxin-Srs1a-like [Salarias fasciatus]|uniref:DELTA-sagatoxin-Srs1a-like n=1 Tax=Salarias fasciatus TaxID=181472 RepID=A0A672IQE5_SALFA|nr:DELTA-sagatoxin-Srs1a-like [Salarias fasciatus]
MSETAEALAANLKTRRNVSIEITNHTSNFCLIDPKIFLESGHCHSPPQPTVRPLRTEVCSFTKNTGKAEGAVGVLSYSVFGKGIPGPNPKDRIAIMFSVPYDRNMYKNWAAVGIYEVSRDVDEVLYKEMYFNKEQVAFERQEAKGSVLVFKGTYLDLMVTMSPLGRCMMKVEVWEKMFNPPTGQSPY